MKNFFTAVLILLLSSSVQLKAQISDYDHPPTVMGQERLSIAKNSNLSVTYDLLVIHDLDEADFSTYVIELMAGDNYSLVENVITPKADYTGLLEIPLKVSDGKLSSDVYTLEVYVQKEALIPDYSVTGQYKGVTQEEEPFSILPTLFNVTEIVGNSSGVFFISPEGEDTNVGTLEAPLKTIAGAKVKVNAYKTQNGIPDAGITVYLRAGEYYYENSLTFGANDSGEKGKFVTYRAYPNEEVRITGAKKNDYAWFKDAPAAITAKIKSSSARTKIKMLDLKAHGITTYGEIGHVGYVVKNQGLPPANIFVNGKAMHLARYPNTDNFADVLFYNLLVCLSTYNHINDWVLSGSSSLYFL